MHNSDDLNAELDLGALSRAVMASDSAWRWPAYAQALRPRAEAPLPGGAGWRRLLQPMLAASYIEWRYYSVLADAFHGIVGLALVNPRQRFSSIAESGLLVILAGAFDRPPMTAGLLPTDGAQTLCWMHLFAVADCRFDQPRAGCVSARDEHCRLTLQQQGPACTDLRLETGLDLALQLTHRGLPGAGIAPVAGNDLRRLPGCHWIVHCAAPVAATSGEIELGPRLDQALAQARHQGAGAYAAPSLLARARGQSGTWRWQDADGYYEHSYGIQPLPLHGWDFLFIPDANRGRSVVLQTYCGSRQLRYVDVCWRDGGQTRHHRFDAAGLSLDWSEQRRDPVLGVSCPLRRLIRAEAPGLRLRVDNRVLQRIPLLRSRRFAVRHFFISEEIGVADWTLSDDRGRIIAEARNQPCGGELAGVRWRTRTGAVA